MPWDDPAGTAWNADDEPGHSARQLFDAAHGLDYEAVATLEEARASDGYAVILSGDDGGQVYLTAPAAIVACTEDELRQLLLDIDWTEWRDPHSADISFECRPSGSGVPGGMGGGAVAEDIWTHPDLHWRVAAAAREVILGRLAHIPPEALTVPADVAASYPSRFGEAEVWRLFKAGVTATVAASYPGDYDGWTIARLVDVAATPGTIASYSSRFNGLEIAALVEAGVGPERAVAYPRRVNGLAIAKLHMLGVTPDDIARYPARFTGSGLLSLVQAGISPADSKRYVEGWLGTLQPTSARGWARHWLRRLFRR